MGETWQVKKAGPGLAIEEMIARMLGSEFAVEEFDPMRPLVQQVNQARVLLVRSMPVSREVIDAAQRLRLIQRPGVHLEGVDLEYANAKGIPVCNVPASLTHGGEDVAEHVMFLALALAKRYREALVSLGARRIGMPSTHVLRGKIFGLVGLGRTGSAVIGMARGLGMRVWAVKRTVTEGMREAMGVDWLKSTDHLPELLGASDFVSLHIPLNQETTGLIGTTEIAMMKPSAFLINVARGGVVDRAALLAALREKRLAGAGLDVYWSEPTDPNDPLLALPNVIATPHVANMTQETIETIARVSVDNIRRVQAGLPPMHQIVNTPHVSSHR
ncbi:MAG TPA: NAD(P)-dependent oxidoreductase [Candidatus Limnocylindrales bacterium]|nr:NAD(P)-dependent oxidoreductase [Candidatus Limnocylindrales bacterium]